MHRPRHSAATSSPPDRAQQRTRRVPRITAPVLFVWKVKASDIEDRLGGDVFVTEADRFELYYSPQQFAETFTHLAAGDFDVTALLTDTIGLDDVPDAFTRLSTSPHDAKILLRPTR